MSDHARMTVLSSSAHCWAGRVDVASAGGESSFTDLVGQSFFNTGTRVFLMPANDEAAYKAASSGSPAGVYAAFTNGGTFNVNHATGTGGTATFHWVAFGGPGYALS